MGISLGDMWVASPRKANCIRVALSFTNPKTKQNKKKETNKQNQLLLPFCYYSIGRIDSTNVVLDNGSSTENSLKKHQTKFMHTCLNL